MPDKRKGVIALFTVLGGAAVAGALLLWPRKASAAPIADETKPESVPGPQNAQEAYGLAMNPSMKDANYVLQLAEYLKREGSHPEWAAAVQKRYYDLKAEELLGEGLKLSTTLDRVTEIARTLQSTHNDYAVVLGQRVQVQRGQIQPVAPFNLPLNSGGSIVVDMKIYVPAAAQPAAAATPPQFPTSSTSSTTSPTTSPTTVLSVPQPPLTSGGATTSTSTTTAPIPAGTPPLAVEETKPENDPYGTIALARLLLDEQSKKGWKYISKAVEVWQGKVGLTEDGKFGPGSALRMAHEVAIMPWIRYWPLGSASKQSAVNSYRGRLKAYALSIEKTRPEHAKALVIAANKETGQGWPTAPSASPGSEPTVEQIDAAVTELVRMRSAS